MKLRGEGRADAAALPLRFIVGRWACAFGLAIVLLSGYMWLSVWNAERFATGLEPHTLFTRWDERLPTVPWMVWPYLTYYALVFAPMFLARRAAEVAGIAAAFVGVTVVAWLCYWLWPVRMIYPSLACGGPSCRVLEWFYATDGGVNVMPSLHAAHVTLAAVIFRSYRSRLTPLVTAAAAWVTLAAVLTRQHYVVDVVAGVPLGLLGWATSRSAFQLALGGSERAAPVAVPAVEQRI